MSTFNEVYKPQAVKINWKRVLVIGGIGLILAVVIGSLSFYLSPPGQRWSADQRTAPPAIGVTQIDVIGDSALNHIFSPAVTQVEAGTEITWHFIEIDENGEPVPHNVVFSDEASPVLATGTFSKTFNEPGTYEYTCTLHAYMDGVVIVTE